MANDKANELLQIRNDKGRMQTVNRATWDLMSSAAEKGDTRKGWTLMGTVAGKKGNGNAVVQDTTMIPKEITEAMREPVKEQEVKDSVLISGEKREKVEAAPAAEAAPPAPAPAEAAPAEAAPAEAAPPPAAPFNGAPDAPPTGKKADDLASLPNMGAKAAEVLAANGISTYAELAKADASKINGILKANSLTPKMAQVPGWKVKAADLAKA